MNASFVRLAGLFAPLLAGCGGLFAQSGDCHCPPPVTATAITPQEAVVVLESLEEVIALVRAGADRRNVAGELAGIARRLGGSDSAEAESRDCTPLFSLGSGQWQSLVSAAEACRTEVELTPIDYPATDENRVEISVCDRRPPSGLCDSMALPPLEQVPPSGFAQATIETAALAAQVSALAQELQSLRELVETLGRRPPPQAHR